MARTLALFLFVPFLLVPGIALGLSGCGGGGDAVPTLTLTLPGEAALDGYAQSNGVAVSAGGSPFLGDADSAIPGVGVRQFFSFSLAGIPPGATIVQAILRVNQEGTIGTPFGTHGVVAVDHVDYGATLTGADFGAGVLATNIATASTGPVPGLRAIPVTAAVAVDVAAAAPRSQYRLRFSLIDSDGDLLDDYVQFTDSENSITGFGVVPTLEITYQVP